MKILLVQPRKPAATFGGEDFLPLEPLALEYLAGALPDRHEVKILDMRIEDDFDGTMRTFRPDVLGITAYTVHVNLVHRLFQRARQIDPRVFTVVGGHHATVAYHDFVVPEVNLIVVGEGSFPFREIIERLEQGRDFEGIAGTVFQRADGELVVTQNAEYDLDSIPFPRRDLTRHYRPHYSSEWMKPIATLRTSKGCPFRCTYCAEWILTGRRYLGRAPSEIIKELRQIKEPYVFLADDESFVQVDRMMELARAIGRAGVRKEYYAYARADTAVRHPGLLEEWKRIGLRRVFVGLEFFRDEDLRAVNKGSTAATNIDAIRLIQDLGLDLFSAFIIRPDFAKQDFADLAQFCRSQNLGFSGFVMLTPLPGTQFYEEVKDRMILRHFDYYDAAHSLLPLKMPAREFYEEYLALIESSLSLANKLAYVRKYPFRELPDLLDKVRRFYQQFKEIYRTYDRLDAINAEQPAWGVRPTFGWSRTTGSLVKLDPPFPNS